MSRRYSGGNGSQMTAWSQDLNGAAWSVCGWVYLVSTASSGGDVFYSRAPSSSTTAILLGYEHNGGSPILRWRAGNVVVVLNYTQSATLGQWYHMALTSDGNTVRAYLDGAEVANAVVPMTTTHDQAELGDFGTNVAELAQVKFWLGHQLSPSELATEIAYWTPQASPASVQGWWQLDNAAPTADSSGHGHTLTSDESTDGLLTVPGALAPPNPTPTRRRARNTMADRRGDLNQNILIAGSASASSALIDTTGLSKLVVQITSVVSAATLQGSITLRSGNYPGIQIPPGTLPALVTSSAAYLGTQPTGFSAITNGVITLNNPSIGTSIATITFDPLLLPRYLGFDYVFTSGGGTVGIVIAAHGW